MKSLGQITFVVPLLLAGLADAATYTVTPLTDSRGTIPASINNHGTIATQQYYSRERRSYILYQDGSSTVVNGPTYHVRDTFALLQGINDSDLAVGIYTIPPPFGEFDRPPIGVSSFLYNNGDYTLLQEPPGTGGTRASDINNAGTMVGAYIDQGVSGVPFVGPLGAFKTMRVPGAMRTSVTAISNTGATLGSYDDAAGTTHGYIQQGGIFATIDHPEGEAAFTGINTSRAVSGHIGGKSFVYAAGVFTPLGPVEPPNNNTYENQYAEDINDRSVVLGWHTGNISGEPNIELFLATPASQALRAFDAARNFGINTHLDTVGMGYEDPKRVAKALRYLGLHNVRDTPKRNSRQTWSYVAQHAGVKFDAYMPSGSITEMQEALSFVDGLAEANLLNFIEGGNDEDNPYPASRGNSLAATANSRSRSTPKARNSACR